MMFYSILCSFSKERKRKSNEISGHVAQSGKARESQYKLQVENTFISSTKDGNPPMAMNVRNEAIKVTSEPLA